MKIITILIASSFLAAGCCIAQPPDSAIPPCAIVTRIDQVQPHPQIVISDTASFTNLLSFFPGMWQEKTTDLAGGWEGKYQIVFQFRGRPEVKVITSSDDQYWSSGKGDKALKPGLSGFLDAKFKKE